MSSSNILPHAPPKKIYSEVPAGHFRLTRITEIERNFRRIWTPQKSCKKYKKAQAATRYAAVGLDMLASTLSISGVAAGLTSPGITIHVPILGVHPFIGLPLPFSTGAKKKTSAWKWKKHDKNYSHALSKRATVDSLVSEGLNYNYKIVNSELEQSFKLKEAVLCNKNHSQALTLKK